MHRALLLGLALVIVACSVTSASAGVLFSSTTDRLTAPDFTIPQSAGTVCFNIYPNWAETDNAVHTFLFIGDTGANNFGLQKFSDNKLRVGWTSASVDNRMFVPSTSYTLNQNAWNSICYTWDGTGQTLYVNGSSVSSSGAPTTHDTNGVGNTLGFVLGNYTTSIDNQNMDGRLAEVAIWNVVLSGANLTDRMNNGRLASCFTGLQNYWSLTGISDLSDHADSENLSNAGGVTNAPDHPTTLACAGGGGGTVPCIFGSKLIVPGCP